MRTTDTTETQYDDVKSSDWAKTALYVATGMLVTVLGATLLFNLHQVRTVLLLVLAGVVIATLVTWRTKAFAYRCAKCGEEFSNRQSRTS